MVCSAGSVAVRTNNSTLRDFRKNTCSRRTKPNQLRDGKDLVCGIGVVKIKLTRDVGSTASRANIPFQFIYPGLDSSHQNNGLGGILLTHGQSPGKSPETMAICADYLTFFNFFLDCFQRVAEPSKMGDLAALFCARKMVEVHSNGGILDIAVSTRTFFGTIYQVVATGAISLSRAFAKQPLALSVVFNPSTMNNAPSIYSRLVFGTNTQLTSAARFRCAIKIATRLWCSALEALDRIHNNKIKTENFVPHA